MSNSSANVSVIDLPAMTVAGASVNFISAMAKGSNAFELLPKLWGQVSEVVASVEVDGKTIYDFNAWMVGAMGEPELPAYSDPGDVADVEGLMNYFAGVRVDGLDAQLVEALLGAGLQLRTFDGGKFAVCEHVGPLDGLGETTSWFYQDWLPTQGPAQRYGHHFEIYDERFRMGSPTSIVMICAPVH